MKHILIILSLILLSSPLFGQSDADDKGYRYKITSGLLWKTIGKGEIQSKYGGYVGSYKNVVPYGKGTIIKSAIAKTNTIWPSQDVGGKMTLAGHKSIDFSSYSSA